MKILADGYVIAKKDLYDYLSRNMVCNHVYDEKVNRVINVVFHYIHLQESGSISKKEIRKQAVDTVYDSIILYNCIEDAVDSISNEYNKLFNEIKGRY